jgi:hypothetical protein
MSGEQKAVKILEEGRPRLQKFITLARDIGATSVAVDFTAGDQYALSVPTGYGVIDERDRDLENAVERALHHIIRWRIR